MTGPQARFYINKVIDDYEAAYFGLYKEPVFARYDGDGQVVVDVGGGGAMSSGQFIKLKVSDVVQATIRFINSMPVYP